jgi:hypothetical protein
MSETLLNFFQENALGVLAKCDVRMADCRHFEQVMNRVTSDEDLSSELPELKSLTRNQCLGVVRELIKKCHQDIVNLWNISATGRIKTTVDQTLSPTELVPRFKVQYDFKTTHGLVQVVVTTVGRNATSEITVGKVKKDKIELAIEQADHILLVEALKK